jgi:hypothetical protein
MKKFLLLIAVLMTASCPFLRGATDTSYLMIQGPFGNAGAMETYQWKVLYEHGSLTYGIDLLNTVFGTATDSGTLYLGKPLYTAGNSTLGATYIDYGSGGSFLFATSYTIGSKTLRMDSSFDPSWNYQYAGGSGLFGGPYASGAWTADGSDGVNSRTLSNGSFDVWVWGSYPGTIVDTATPGDNNPTAGNFASATVVNLVPEPGSAGLLLLGATGLWLRRRRP